MATTMVTAGRVIDSLLEATVLGSYTRVGCALRRRIDRWEDLDARSLSGQVVLVTGATTGLGRAAATRLGSMGARVRIVGRDGARTEEAARAISELTGAEVAVHVADMSDVEAVRRIVDEVRAAEKHVDVLVNNAGALLATRSVSRQGHEMSLATMVLGPLVLTEGLADRLTWPAPGRPGRVVNVSSGGMYTQRLDVDDLQCERGYRGTVAYARAKRALVVLSELWARQWDGRGIVVHAMHPGWAATPGVHASLPRFARALGPLLRTPEQGADTIVWLAAADAPARSTGRFWHDRRARRTHRLPWTREPPAARAALWERLHELAGQPAGPAPS
jgi:dehydrogenase/reductase SDR family protein 12